MSWLLAPSFKPVPQPAILSSLPPQNRNPACELSCELLTDVPPVVFFDADEFAAVRAITQVSRDPPGRELTDEELL
jgi:hypothetical protein